MLKRLGTFIRFNYKLGPPPRFLVCRAAPTLTHSQKIRNKENKRGRIRLTVSLSVCLPVCLCVCVCAIRKRGQLVAEAHAQMDIPDAFVWGWAQPFACGKYTCLIRVCYTLHAIRPNALAPPKQGTRLRCVHIFVQLVSTYKHTEKNATRRVRSRKFAANSSLE